MGTSMCSNHMPIQITVRTEEEHLVYYKERFNHIPASPIVTRADASTLVSTQHGTRSMEIQADPRIQSFRCLLEEPFEINRDRWNTLPPIIPS